MTNPSFAQAPAPTPESTDAVTPIATDRLDLRAPRPSDAGLIEHYASDERVARMTRSIPHPLPPGATEAFVAGAMSRQRREDIWVMDGMRAGLGEVVGVIGLEPMEGAPDQSEIGYWVAPALWNAGLASEAVTALLDANPHGSKTIFASVFQDNPISARVLTRAGFDYLGDAEAFSVSRGSTVATWTYLLRLRG
ncbi:MAG: GNAT family N-acetyltransferase [Pseudomonadota bacterium]